MRLLTSLLACFVALAASAAVEIGKPAPEFTAKDKDGKTVSLSDFKGKTKTFSSSPITKSARHSHKTNSHPAYENEGPEAIPQSNQYANHSRPHPCW